VESWHRHLEGWQLAVVAVGFALGAAALALPRAVVPREIPLPTVDRREERRMDADRRRLVDEVRGTPLPFLVRATGEALRRFGVAEYGREDARGVALADEIVKRAAAARSSDGDRALLALRAVQADLFVHAVTTWARAGDGEADVIALGGGFARHARRHGWIEGKRLIIEEDGLRQLFVLRWTKLAGFMDTQPFAPTLNELRLYYRTLLRHPEQSSGTSTEDPYILSGLQLAYVNTLAKQDPDYPVLLARGILEFRVGRFDDATALLAAHLKEHPDGPWRLRAQNYFVAARERRESDED
jgi:hypothetical protein